MWYKLVLIDLNTSFCDFLLLKETYQHFSFNEVSLQITSYKFTHLAVEMACLLNSTTRLWTKSLIRWFGSSISGIWKINEFKNQIKLDCNLHSNLIITTVYRVCHRVWLTNQDDYFGAHFDHFWVEQYVWRQLGQYWKLSRALNLRGI